MIRAWLLPLIVLAIAAPIVAGFAIAGPGLGLAVGALVAGVLIVVVARMRPETRIEVAEPPDPRHRVLVVALTPIEDPAAATEVASAAGPGSDVLVLVPAANSPLAHWTDDLGEARDEAQRSLVLSLGSLAAAEIEARGRVGDSDPIQAVEDTLHEFAADEALVVAAPVSAHDSSSRLWSELRSRLDLPVRLLET